MKVKISNELIAALVSLALAVQAWEIRHIFKLEAQVGIIMARMGGRAAEIAKIK